jgi:hypothetical protein
MRPLAVALVALLLVPVSAAGKEPDAAVRVLWNSTPNGVQAGGSWDARLSLLQGPGGFYERKARPVIVVTELATGAEERVPMAVDVPPNTFRAAVGFPRAGRYEVAVAGFDPRDPERFADVGRPVRVEPAAAATAGGGEWWPWALVGGAAIAALMASAWSLRRAPARNPT